MTTIHRNQVLSSFSQLLVVNTSSNSVLLTTGTFNIGNSTNFVTVGSNAAFAALANNSLFANSAAFLGALAANNYVATHLDSTITANVTFTSNVIFANTLQIFANGQFGSVGQTLISNGSSVYWGLTNPSNPSPLIFSSSGSTRSITGYEENGITFPVRSTAITGGALQFTLASFTPVLSASISPSSSLNWDVPVTGFSVSVTNPSDFTTEYISNVYSITASTGSASDLNTFTPGALSPTPAGGVSWSESFTLGSGYIYSPSTTIAGGSASGIIRFIVNNNGTTTQYTDGSASYNVGWATPSLNISTASLSGSTFLQSYSSTSYNVSISGISNSSNYVNTVTTSNGTVTNASGSGTFNFTAAIHKDNTGTARTVNISTVFTRPVGVTGTSYTATLTGSSTVSASFSYPSLTVFTSSASNPPSRSTFISGSGFAGAVTVLGNQQKIFAGYVNNSQSSPQAFWLAVRSSASQPTIFQTGASPGLLSGVAATTGYTVALAPDSPPSGYTAESYNLYGITLQPGSTYVSIS